MSQASGMMGEASVLRPAGRSTTGRAVLLLAVAVALGTALLHELDNATTSIGNNTTASENSTQQASTQPVTPTTATTLPPRSPAEVKVMVANGIGVQGAAGKVADRLRPIGYQLLSSGNTTNRETNSLIEYAPGYQNEALSLATSLGIAATAVQPLPTPLPVADLQGGNILVIVGSQLANAPASTSQAQSQPSNANAASNTPANNATQGQSTQQGQTQTQQGQTQTNSGVNGPLGRVGQ